MVRMEKIAVALSANSVAVREFISGIFRFANTRHSLNILLLENYNAITPGFVASARKNGVDGVITGMLKSTPGYRALIASNLPSAFIGVPKDTPPPHARHSMVVLNDDRAIGRMGATYLRSRGQIRSFAFLRTSDADWAVMRQKGFVDEMARFGVKPAAYDGASGCNGAGLQEHIGEWLKSLPKPAALMAASDADAHLVVGKCAEERIRIPEQIMVLGVDNDELICNHVGPSISSIDPNHAMLGFRACEALCQIMRGTRRKAASTIYVPPIQVVERDSTRTIPPARHLIREALAFMRQNHLQGISAADVARHLGISESLLRLRFRTIHGRSVRDILLDMRLEAARRMLRENQEPVSRIAAACGFSSTSHLSHFFRKRLGVSPRDWRSNAGQGASTNRA